MTKAVGATITAAIGIVCLAPAQAAGETVTIGSALSSPSTGAVCTMAGCLGVEVGQAGGNAPFPLTSPVNGRVTSYSIRTADIAATFQLRVLKQNGAGPMGPNYTALTSSAVSPPVPTAVDSVIPYPTSVPISAGNSIGVTIGGTTDGLPQYTSANNSDVMAYMTNLADGASQDSFANGMHELNLQATIQFCRVPDLSGKAQADATAALTAADCAAGAITTTPLVFKKKKVKSKKKRKKQTARLAQLRAMDGKVASQGTTAGTTAAPGTTVSLTVNKLQIKKKKKKKHKK